MGPANANPSSPSACRLVLLGTDLGIFLLGSLWGWDENREVLLGRNEPVRYGIITIVISFPSID